tara:strand:+ start:1505 stop:1909 length:405 start_codon:yes stop_codon:yes gene_type:complete
MKNSKIALQICVLIVSLIVLSGCSSLGTKNYERQPDVAEATCTAMQNLPDINKPEPLDLSEYENIRFFMTKSVVNGEERPVISLSVDDFKKLNLMIRAMGDHMSLQYKTLQKVYQFYNESMDTEKMGKPDIIEP